MRAATRGSRAPCAPFALAFAAALALVAALGLAACGGAGRARPPDHAAREGTGGGRGDDAPAASGGTPGRREDPEPFEPIDADADVVTRFVRAERSSRLAVPLPRGAARLAFSVALAPRVDPVFVLAAGARIVVEGRGGAFVIVDRRGRPVASGDLGGGSRFLLAPRAAALHAVSATELAPTVDLRDDRTREPTAPTPPARGVATGAAVRGAVSVLALPGAITMHDDAGDRRLVEGAFDALDVAIDAGDADVLHAIVRQRGELALWSTPLSGGSIGRVRLPDARRERAAIPPILGKDVRVVVLDDRMVALARDGKKLWERRGAVTGGATITSDDRLLVADGPRVIVVDPSGRATAVASLPRAVFVTPPILTGGGLLVVASGDALHAFAFE